MADYRRYCDLGWNVIGEAHTPAVQLVSDLRALFNALPLKGYRQDDILAIVIGMASEQHPSDDYARGYHDGINALLLRIETPLDLLNSAVANAR